MELHHSKHHQTYVTNLNKALDELIVVTNMSFIPAQIALQAAIRFNGGGHINHSLFWQNLAPPNSTDTKFSSAPALSEAIKKTWRSEKAFREQFNAALLGIQGSGWGWLVKYETEGNRLAITTTKDQDPIMGYGEVPIIGIDIWEHAFYLQVR
jgi:superoxide dismutase, Fe-Mn family